MAHHVPLQGATVLTPFRSLFWRALWAVTAFLLPVGAVLYFLTIPDGPWLIVLIVQIVASLLFGIASSMFFMTRIWVRPEGIVERGYFGSVTRFDIDDIDRAVLVETFYGGGAETVPQLFLCGADGGQLVRMRGQFWSRADMLTVCDILGVPLTENRESISRQELLSRYPGLLYSFERHPFIAAAIFSSVIISAGVVLFAILALLEVPLAAG